jgi:uncharacterized protein (UPF0332 family)
MKEDTGQLLDKARRAIDAAQTLLDAGPFPDFATGRSYYTMFYVAEALLGENDLRFSKHGGVHGAVGEHYIKPVCWTQNFIAGC